MRWQEDASGNVSGYIAMRKLAVSPTAGTLTVDASQANSFLINVTASITSMSIINPTDGQEITLLWAQDTSGHSVAVASNILMGSLSVSTAANTHTTVKLTYNSGDANWYAIGQSGL